MIDLTSSQSVYYWTFDSFEDLKQERKTQEFGESVWKRNVITSHAIGIDYVTFDTPEDWGAGFPPVKFEMYRMGRTTIEQMEFNMKRFGAKRNSTSF